MLPSSAPRKPPLPFTCVQSEIIVHGGLHIKTTLVLEKMLVEFQHLVKQRMLCGLLTGKAEGKGPFSWVSIGIEELGLAKTFPKDSQI